MKQIHGYEMWHAIRNGLESEDYKKNNEFVLNMKVGGFELFFGCRN